MSVLDMISFDEATHTYTDSNGLIVPGVTSVINFLYDFSHIDPRTIRDKALLGTAVHKACELHDNNELDIFSLHSKIKPYFDAWLLFLDDTGFEVLENETKVYNEKYGYAGTLDRIGILNDNIALLDIKCTAIISAIVGVQLSAYREAHKTHKIKKSFACQLKPNGKYKLFELKNHGDDFKMFAACLDIYKWRCNYDKQFWKNYHGDKT